MVDLLEADKLAGVGFQNFRHQRLPVFPGMGTVLGQTESEIKRHDGNRPIGFVFDLFGKGYGGDLCHRDIECDIPFRLSTPGRTRTGPQFIHKTALEYTPGSARVLSRIVRAVGGDICVLADGGVRSGGDIPKMLALGADAVMIGRPLCVAALGGLKEGVKTFIETIRTELIQAMVLTGTPQVDQVDEFILFKA